MSACIMLIRHAEKPNGSASGVDEAGDRDDCSLSVQGWRRAGALTPYFAGLAERLHRQALCRPQYIVAARPTHHHPSTRPRDTVQGLADRLGITVDDRWSDLDAAANVAKHLCALDGPVLVCWRHDELPDLARAIHADEDMPEVWPADRFDMTWSFRRDHGRWQFEQVPQLLIAGDRLTPIDWPDARFKETRRGRPLQHYLATQPPGPEPKRPR